MTKVKGQKPFTGYSYGITNQESGHYFGVYKGNTPEDAIIAMLKAAGHFYWLILPHGRNTFDVRTFDSPEDIDPDLDATTKAILTVEWPDNTK